MPRPHIRALFDRLAGAEESLQSKEFLAPALRNGLISVRIEKVVCSLRPSRPFEGWGIFRSTPSGKAEMVRTATLRERQSYLDLFPKRHLILCARQGRHWLTWPAHQSDGRFGQPSMVIVHLVKEAELFDTIVARFDGARHWFERTDERADPVRAAYLRSALTVPVEPDRIERRGLSAEARTAYADAYSLMIASKRDPTEERLRRALTHAGAHYRSHAPLDDGYRIEFTVDGVRHISSIGAADLTVQLAGICLNGEDSRFDLTSLVGVLREADGSEVLRVGEEGLPADRYWQVHPRH
jgi:hypothetical protein